MDVMFLVDRFGYARCIDMATYERNKEAADSENRFVFNCKNIGKVCLFTDNGQLHTIKVQDVPFGKFRDKGVPLDNVSNYDTTKENIIYVTSQSDLNLYRVVFVTAQGMVKIVDGGEFDVAKRTVAATKKYCITDNRWLFSSFPCGRYSGEEKSGYRCTWYKVKC